MSRIFAITAASDRVSIGGDGRGEITFTVTNSSARPLRGQLRLRPLGSTKGEWLNIAGETERNFSPNATQQVIVKVAAPAGAPAGKYQFRLDAISVINPDDDFTEGPAVDLDIKATEAPKKKFPWLIVAAAAGALVLIAALTLFLLFRNKTEVVFEDDFNGSPKNAWSTTKTEMTPNGATKFLGQFYTETAQLRLKDMPSHKTVKASFDLYIINTWQGLDPKNNDGPDEWGLLQGELDPNSLELGKRSSPPINVINGATLIYTTFSNGDSFRQNYACENGAQVTSSCYFKDERAGFGSAIINSLGYNTFPHTIRDCVYKIKVDFAHDKSDLVLTFFGNLKEGLASNRNTGNEGWGIDNVRIEVE
ncbi:MAG TPA: hypothetical protein VFY40_06555 [Blastocatellia bacterium]|nr:hypothetical protein [Blastocatellia bacterium]